GAWPRTGYRPVRDVFACPSGSDRGRPSSFRFRSAAALRLELFEAIARRSFVERLPRLLVAVLRVARASLHRQSDGNVQENRFAARSVLSVQKPLQHLRVLGRIPARELSHVDGSLGNRLGIETPWPRPAFAAFDAH